MAEEGFLARVLRSGDYCHSRRRNPHRVYEGDQVKRILWTLNVGNYAPDITAITYPLIKEYARKIRAEFRIIDKPYDLGVEDCKISGKFHLFELAKAERDTWSIYLDSDALVHPDAFDYCACLDRVDDHGRPSVFSFGRDFAYERFHPDALRSTYVKGLKDDKGEDMPQTAGEGIGMCTWFIIVSDLSAQLWEPPMDPDAAIEQIQPTVQERHIKTARSLLDDYQTSINAAKYNLSVTFAHQVHDIARLPKLSFWHTHLLTESQKVKQMKDVIHNIWRLNDTPADVFRRQEKEFAKMVKDRKEKK